MQMQVCVVCCRLESAMYVPFYTSRPAIGYGTYEGIHERERQIHSSVHWHTKGTATNRKPRWHRGPLLDGANLRLYPPNEPLKYFLLIRPMLISNILKNRS